METKKKLLMINGNQFGYSAGHYYYCKYLKDIFDIEYICYDRGRKKMYMEGVNVHYLSFSGSKIQRVINFFKYCTSFSKKFKPDILFIVYFNFSFILASLCKSKIKILDIRTGALNTNKLARKTNNYIIHFQSLFFKKCIILSESLRILLKIPTSKCLTLPLGADIFYHGNHAFNDLRLLYVGALDSRNIHETIEGLSLFINKNLSKREKTSYTIIGFGTSEEENKLKGMITNLNLTDIVKFEGLKNHDELIPYFEKCNIGVAYIPITEFYNVQPATKIFEYGLSGLYTIATNTNENKLFINESNGILCQDNPQAFADSLVTLINKKSAINSDRIRNSFLNYSWENIVKSQLASFLNKFANSN